MLRPDFAIRPIAPTEATRPAAAVGGGRGFAGLMGDVRADVDGFIAAGSGPSMPVVAAPFEEPSSAALLTPEAQRLRQASTGFPLAADPAAFVAGISPAAEQAARQLGVAPELVVAHAALESGWGRKPLRHPDGSATHNLFGVKAGAGWAGEVAVAATTEVEAGAAVARQERFRSYPDAGAAFDDYARLLLSNPRYRAALNTGSDAQAFAQGLARGGYATDPAYAAKLTGVAQRLLAAEDAR